MKKKRDADWEAKHQVQIEKQGMMQYIPGIEKNNLRNKFKLSKQELKWKQKYNEKVK